MAIPRSKTDLTDILEYGVDQRNRIVYFGKPISVDSDDIGDVTQGSIEIAFRAIQTMILDAPNKPISLYMNSYGGDPYAMLYLVDLITTSPCQFKFYGGGAIMSSATWVMAVCDERHLYPNATIMVHKGFTGVEGNVEDVHISVEEEKRLMSELITIYAQNSFMPEDFWSEVCKRDLYLSAQEAVQLGLADAVIKPKKRANLRKKRLQHLSTLPNPKTIKSLVKKIHNRIGINAKIRDINITLPPKDEADDQVVVDNTPLELVEENTIKEQTNE